MILLDTHAFIWWTSDRDRLSKKALKYIEAHSQELAFSVVSAWEIALLHKKKRLELPLSPTDFIERALKHYGIEELVLHRTTALKAVNLPDIHDDPFDRVLIAEAQVGKLKLVTKDSVIPKYPGLHIIW